MTFEEWFLKKHGSFERQFNLAELSCHNNNISSLKGIESLVNLEVLYCYNNNISSLKRIENLLKLKVLSCYNNNISSLKGIECLVNLEELSCDIKLLNKNILKIPDLKRINGQDINKTRFKYYFNIRKLIKQA